MTAAIEPPAADHVTDVIIIGAGPVGLFAIFECGMLKMRCHVIDSLEQAGGQCRALYPEKPIYDIPGYPRIDAGALIDRLEEQAAPFSPTYHLRQTVTGYSAANGWHSVTTSAGKTIAARAVIIAAGAGAFGPNRPPLDGLEAYEGKSVFYMVRKREDFTGKRIVIAGGGDSAVDWALSLHDIAAKIYMVHRRDKFRAAPESLDRLQSMSTSGGKIEIITPCQLHALHGSDGYLTGVDVADLDGKTRRLDADVLLPFFGLAPALGALNDWGLGITQHHIPVNQSDSQTKISGVFAIGDIATYKGKIKLILTGFAEAAQAAHAIHPLVFEGQALHFEYSTSKGIP